MVGFHLHLKSKGVRRTQQLWSYPTCLSNASYSLDFGKDSSRKTHKHPQVFHSAPGTLPLEMWELRKGMCPVKDESQLSVSFNHCSTVIRFSFHLQERKSLCLICSYAMSMALFCWPTVKGSHGLHPVLFYNFGC